MDLNRFNRQKTSRIYLYVLLLIACSLISFLMGVVSLRNGTLRKLYDIYDAIGRKNEIKIRSQNQYTPDTFYLHLSKKNYNQIVKLRSDSFLTPRNYLNHQGWQWIGERPWVKAVIIHGNDSLKYAKVKLMGMNTDHFREGSNWSLRVKLNNENFYHGYSKFNLLNPYSRGFFVDQFYNSLYKREGGLYIDQLPVYTKLGDYINPQVIEPFFSKELLESQQRRDYLIFTFDSTDRNGIRHLKVVHPKNDINALTKRQQIVYFFYDSIFSLGKLVEYYNEKNYAFSTAVALNTGGQTHHYSAFNLYLYADPISGDLKPFIREVEPVFNNKKIQDYSSFKTNFYAQHGLNAYVKGHPQFDLMVDKYVSYFQKINFNDVVLGDANLSNIFNFVNQNYFWAHVYKNRLKVSISGVKLPNNETVSNKKLTIFSGIKTYTDTAVVFSNLDSIVFIPGAQLVLKNTSLVFNHTNLSYTDIKHKLLFNGDSLSTIIFDNLSINFNNVAFTGFSNRLNRLLKNRELTGAITFANSNVSLHNSSFTNNYSGDDLVNFFRCQVFIEKSIVSGANADGIDFDFTSGKIINSKVVDCGNDGLDLGGSTLQIKNLTIAACMDKGISIGEASKNVEIDSVILSSNEIGITLKDESELSIQNVHFNQNKVDFVAYAKKAQYGSSQITWSNLDFSKISFLVEPGVVFPKNVPVARTNNVIDLMYGKKYGRKSVR